MLTCFPEVCAAKDVRRSPSSVCDLCQRYAAVLRLSVTISARACSAHGCRTVCYQVPQFNLTSAISMLEIAKRHRDSQVDSHVKSFGPILYFSVLLILKFLFLTKFPAC